MPTPDDIYFNRFTLLGMHAVLRAARLGYLSYGSERAHNLAHIETDRYVLEYGNMGYSTHPEWLYECLRTPQGGAGLGTGAYRLKDETSASQALRRLLNGGFTIIDCTQGCILSQYYGLLLCLEENLGVAEGQALFDTLFGARDIATDSEHRLYLGRFLIVHGAQNVLPHRSPIKPINPLSYFLSHHLMPRDLKTLVPGSRVTVHGHRDCGYVHPYNCHGGYNGIFSHLDGEVVHMGAFDSGVKPQSHYRAILLKSFLAPQTPAEIAIVGRADMSRFDTSEIGKLSTSYEQLEVSRMQWLLDTAITPQDKRATIQAHTTHCYQQARLHDNHAILPRMRHQDFAEAIPIWVPAKLLNGDNLVKLMLYGSRIIQQVKDLVLIWTRVPNLSLRIEGNAPVRATQHFDYRIATYVPTDISLMQHLFLKYVRTGIGTHVDEKAYTVSYSIHGTHKQNADLFEGNRPLLFQSDYQATLDKQVAASPTVNQAVTTLQRAWRAHSA